MDNKGYGNIPSTLYECITFIVHALPIRSVPTFIELLIVAMITRAGFVTEATLKIHGELEQSPEHQRLCLTRAALREGKTQLGNNLQAARECSLEPLRKVGVEAILCLPVLYNGDSYGVLSIFSPTPYSFVEDEVKLMEELARDLAFGITNLRTGSERDRTGGGHCR